MGLEGKQATALTPFDGPRNITSLILTDFRNRRSQLSRWGDADYADWLAVNFLVHFDKSSWHSLAWVCIVLLLSNTVISFLEITGCVGLFCFTGIYTQSWNDLNNCSRWPPWFFFQLDIATISSPSRRNEPPSQSQRPLQRRNHR